MGASSSHQRLGKAIPKSWAVGPWTEYADKKWKVFGSPQDREQFIEYVEAMLSNNGSRDLYGLDFKLWYLNRPNGAHVVSLVALRNKVVAIKIESNNDSKDWHGARVEFRRYVTARVSMMLRSIPDPKEVQVKLPKAATPDVPPAYGSKQ